MHCQKQYKITALILNNYMYALAIAYTIYVVDFTDHVNIVKLSVCHLGCKHEHEYEFFPYKMHSKLPTKSLANCIFRANCQIFNLPMIPCSYTVQLQMQV